MLTARKLGKKAPLHDPRTLRLSKYLRPNIPPAPSTLDLTPAVTAWGMMLNDSLGDCTCAAAGHLIVEWTANAAAPFTPADADILATYEKVGHYNPADPSTDLGAVELVVLRYWKNKGIAGHRICGFVAIDVHNRDHLRQAAWLFGGAYIGIALPATAQNQTVWDVTDASLSGDAAPGTWGGHAVCVVGYNAIGPVVVTWGQTLQMTWAFWDCYVDEAYAILSKDVFTSGKSFSGFDYHTLQTDLAAVAAY